MIDKKSSINIKFLSLTAVTLMLATGFKLVSNKEKEKELLTEQEVLLQEYEQLLNEYYMKKATNNNTPPTYNGNDIKQFYGKTIYYVSDSEEQEEQVETKDNIYTYSDEYIMQEDGVLHEVSIPLDLEFESTDEMIRFYSKVFQLDDTIIANKIYELMEEDYNNWENSYTLNGISYDTEEQAIARTILNISLFPEDFNLEEENIRKEEYELGEFIPEELIYKFSEVIGVNPNIALAIAYGESGILLNSSNFQNNYNVAGLHKRSGDPSPTTSSGYIIFKNPAEGLFRFIVILHDNFGVTEDSDKNKINSIASTYCEIPDYWKSLVCGIYNDLVNNGYDYYYNTYNYQDRDLIYPINEKQLEK